MGLSAGTVIDSPLKGKTLIFLGSSVTYGAAAQGVSFADYIGIRNGCSVIKEAVSGTTLVDNGEGSYIDRLKKIDRTVPADIFICQLSTNDATQKKPLGRISGNGEPDTSTIMGAIEFIIDYASDVWGCPVVFYTNPRYESTEYGLMVDMLNKTAEKKGIYVIDLWNDAEFNDISEDERRRYMADPIHPTKEGYLDWWTPYIEKKLSALIQ